MADRLSLVTREIERIVTAPYVPALQDLQDLVLNSSPNVVRAWADCKPCQVALLAHRLLEALPCSSAALPLLCACASVRDFRDALLKKQPVLLDQLLQKAVDDGDSRSFQACIALLSHPLPGGTVPPASLSPFIMRLIRLMVDNSCAETIYPLYRVMGGLHGSPSLLAALPEEIMTSFQIECTKTLRNLDDHMGNLLCLATFARVTAARKYDGSPNQGADSIPNWLQNTRQFFGPKRALKTLDLVVLRVILACSANCNLSATKTVESVRLAMEICDTVEPEQKEAWLRSNTAKIAKLCEKVGREGIDTELQIMGLAFLASFQATGPVPEGLGTICKEKLLCEESRRVLQTMPDNIAIPLISNTTVYLDEAALSEFLGYAFSALKDETDLNHDTFNAAHMARRVVAAMHQSNYRLLAPSISRFLSTTGRELLDSRLETFPLSLQPCCEGSGVCYAAFSAAQNELFVDLVFLCSISAFSDHTGDGDLILFQAATTLASFSSKVKSSLSSNHSCSYLTSKPSASTNPLSLYSALPVTFEAGTSRDWKAKMAEILMQNAHTSHESIVRRVEEICRDLEFRCHNVEAPLRVVSEERDQIASDVEALKRHKRELEIQAEQSSHTIFTLQQDMARLEKQAKNASARAEDLSSRLAAAQKEHEDERRDSQESAVSEREKARTRELDLMATLTEKEDQLEELQDEVRERMAENERLQKTVDAISKENVAGLETSTSLRREINELKESLGDKTNDCAQRNEEIKRLLSDKEQMSSEIGRLQKKLEDEASESDKLRIALQEEKESHKSDVATLQQQHQSEISRITAEALQEAAKLTEEAKVLRITMQAAESKANSEQKAADRRIQRLQQKVESLRNERAAKAREFSEAQEHISRLMSVMGFKSDRTEVPRTISKAEQPKSVVAASRSRLQREVNSQDQVDASPFETQQPVQASFDSTASSNCAPTPKRPKSSRRSRALSHASFHDEYDNARPEELYYSSPRSKTGRSERVRRPLGEVDRNSPTKSQQNNSKGSQDEDPSTQLESQVGMILEEERLQNLSLDFSEADIFTSTPSRLL